MDRRIVTTVCGVLAISAMGICLGDAVADTTTQPAATMPATTTSAAITWDQAAKHIGETLTITGPVKGTHVTSDGKSLILNVGKDYPDPARFSIMIKIDDKNPASADTYQDKTVTVTGKIEKFRKTAEVKVTAAEVTVGK